MPKIRGDISHDKGQSAKMDQASERPLITFVLVAYNHEKYVKQAIESALSQTYRPIQFIFSDDCSSDCTFDLMREAVEQYEGKENILLNRNDQNLGVVDHLNKIFIELAEGKYFIQLGGDDIATPDRTEKVVDCFASTGASMVAINPILIDEEGVVSGNRFIRSFPSGLLKFEDLFVNGAPFFGGDIDKELFDIYGPMKNSARNEDRILPFRASTLGGVAYLSDLVYYYREHGKNMSFWVKMKQDPMNHFRYLIAFKKNELQNIANFMQEVKDSYPGEHKEEMLKQIDKKYYRGCFDLAIFESGFSPQLSLVPAVFRIEKKPKEIIRLLLICMSPRIYQLLLTARKAFR